MMQATDDSEQIAAGLERLAAFLRMAEWRAADPLGLTPTQTACLSFLLGRGASRVGSLARHLSVTQATASDALSALVRKRLVERRPDPDDRRATLVGLTPKGRRLAADVARPPAALALAVDALSPGEQAGMRRALSKMILALQQSGAIEPQRLCLTCRFFRPFVHSDAEKPHHCAFVDAAFGDASLRLDCADHEEAGPQEKASALSTFETA